MTNVTAEPKMAAAIITVESLKLQRCNERQQVDLDQIELKVRG